MNPFAQSPFASASTVESDTTQTEVATTAVEVTDTAEVKEKKPRKPRAQSNRRKTSDEVKFILENYREMNTSEIARKLGLTAQQVSRTVLDARKAYEAKAETMDPAKAQRVREWIEYHLPSKIDQFGKGGGKRGSMVDNLFDDIFGDL
jgi:hypothetical protein